jgi:hypothetical protein
MRRVLGDDQDERLHPGEAVLVGVHLKVGLRVLVQDDPVLELDAFELRLADGPGVEVGPGGDGGLLHKAVSDRLGQPVLVDDVLETLCAPAALDLRRRRQLQAEDRPELVQDPHPGVGTVAVRLVHDEDEIVEAGEVLEVALADALGEPLDARGLAAPDLGIHLRDVEDVDVDRAEELRLSGPTATLVVLARYDLRGVAGKLAEALEDVFWRVRREVADQLVVDRQVGREHEKVPDAALAMEIRDEGAHEPRLANAGGQREAERGEIALERPDRRELRADHLQGRHGIGRLRRRDDLHDPR